MIRTTQEIAGHGGAATGDTSRRHGSARLTNPIPITPVASGTSTIGDALDAGMAVHDRRENPEIADATSIGLVHMPRALSAIVRGRNKGIESVQPMRGVEVHGSDGEYIGILKALDSRGLVVERLSQPDIYVLPDGIDTVSDQLLVLMAPSRQVGSDELSALEP